MGKKQHLPTDENVNIDVDSEKIYLCSFPRSGNSWLRYCMETYGGEPTHSVYAKPKHDDSVTMGYQPNSRIIKSHEPVSQYHNVIFLYRHPFDTLLSWSVFDYGPHVLDDPEQMNLYLQGQIYCTINQIERFKDYIQDALLTHDRSQLNIKYENLIENFLEEFEKVVIYCGWEWDKDKAITMRQKDSKTPVVQWFIQRNTCGAAGDSTYFIRKDKPFISKWKTHFHHSTKDLLRKHLSYIAERFGYSSEG